MRVTSHFAEKWEIYYFVSYSILEPLEPGTGIVDMETSEEDDVHHIAGLPDPVPGQSMQLMRGVNTTITTKATPGLSWLPEPVPGCSREMSRVSRKAIGSDSDRFVHSASWHIAIVFRSSFHELSFFRNVRDADGRRRKGSKKDTKLIAMMRTGVAGRDPRRRNSTSGVSPGCSRDNSSTSIIDVSEDSG